jgi:hypothetical protein
MKKFKVSGSCIGEVFFSRIYEIDEAQFSDDEVIDYVTELSSEDAQFFDSSEWDSEGSEDAGDGGFTIHEIKELT